MMAQVEIEQELQAIKERNRRVETDKAWETSWVRRLFIAGGIYVIAGLWLGIIDANDPWQNSLVPTIGYLLSTLTLPVVKGCWIKKLRN